MKRLVNNPGMSKQRSREAVKRAVIDAASFRKWGCSYAEYLSLRRMCKPMRVFRSQRQGARHRGIGWELNLWQWWTVWQESGHWEHRGRGQGYVMSRHGDLGPYAIGNVSIVPGIVNNSDRAAKLSGLPIGVSSKRKRFRAGRMVGGYHHYLGVYATPELAHAAYLALGPIGRET